MPEFTVQQLTLVSNNHFNMLTFGRGEIDDPASAPPSFACIVRFTYKSILSGLLREALLEWNPGGSAERSRLQYRPPSQTAVWDVKSGIPRS
jgi:hypothetical protein